LRGLIALVFLLIEHTYRQTTAACFRNLGQGSDAADSLDYIWYKL
jgi:hypothetical protein